MQRSVYALTLCLLAVLPAALAEPLPGVTNIVFAARRVNDDGHWYANFGYYAADPLASSATIEARILAQASGIRTLFAEHPEAGVAWIDARNPGRVYFRARG